MPRTAVAQATALVVLTIAGVTTTGCGRDSASPITPTPAPMGITVLPDRVVAGSADLTMDIHGSGFCCASEGTGTRFSKAVWVAQNTRVDLDTTYVTEDHLTAFIPAGLLRQPVTVRIVVETRDGPSVPVTVERSAPAMFEVLPDTRVAISISPTSAPAGSPDVQLMITGSGFLNAGNHRTSWAVWLANGESHRLPTTFVSTTQLLAVVQASLLTTQLQAQIQVWTGDPMDEATPSLPVEFQVTAP